MSLIEFPTDFTVKVIGQNIDDFEQQVHEAIKHIVEVKNSTIKPSKENKYLSLSIEFHAHDQAMIDQTYLAIKQLSFVKVIL